MLLELGRANAIWKVSEFIWAIDMHVYCLGSILLV